MLIKKICFFGAIFLATPLLMAQYKLSGTIKDSDNKEPLNMMESVVTGAGYSPRDPQHVEPKSPQGVNFQQLRSKFFNEMLDDRHMSAEASQNIEKWLFERSLAELKVLNQEAKEFFLYHGITFTVYGDAEGTERTIPYDLIPRVIAKKQWDKIAAGCAQRVHALNYFLDDIYNRQEILKSGIVPEVQVLSHEAFQPQMLNFKLKGNIYSQISGIDIIRDRSGEFFVLELCTRQK